jgi:hypothetical protein
MAAHEVRARLSAPSWAAWDRWVTQQGVTTTALIEAIAVELGEGWNPPARIVKRAREIDRARRSR